MGNGHDTGWAWWGFDLNWDDSSWLRTERYYGSVGSYGDGPLKPSGEGITLPNALSDGLTHLGFVSDPNGMHQEDSPFFILITFLVILHGDFSG